MNGNNSRPHNAQQTEEEQKSLYDILNRAIDAQDYGYIIGYARKLLNQAQEGINPEYADQEILDEQKKSLASIIGNCCVERDRKKIKAYQAAFDIVYRTGYVRREVVNPVKNLMALLQCRSDEPHKCVEELTQIPELKLMAASCANRNVGTMPTVHGSLGAATIMVNLAGYRIANGIENGDEQSIRTNLESLKAVHQHLKAAIEQDQPLVDSYSLHIDPENYRTDGMAKGLIQAKTKMTQYSVTLMPGAPRTSTANIIAYEMNKQCRETFATSALDALEFSGTGPGYLPMTEALKSAFDTESNEAREMCAALQGRNLQKVRLACETLSQKTQEFKDVINALTDRPDIMGPVHLRARSEGSALLSLLSGNHTRESVIELITKRRQQAIRELPDIQRNANSLALPHMIRAHLELLNRIESQLTEQWNYEDRPGTKIEDDEAEDFIHSLQYLADSAMEASEMSQPDCWVTMRQHGQKVSEDFGY